MLVELLNLGKVSDKKAFASSVGCSTSMITEISKGRSTFPITIYDEDDIAKKSFKYSDFEDTLK